MTRSLKRWYGKLFKTAFALGLLWGLSVQAGTERDSAYQTGLALYAQGKYTGAFAYFLRATRQDERNVNARYYLADTLVRIDRRVEAREEYRKILKLAPNSRAARLSALGLARLQESSRPAPGGSWRIGGQPAGRRDDRYVGSIGEGDTYLDQVTGTNGAVRWSLLKSPLKVYIESTPLGIRNFQPAFPTQVRRALDVWMNVLDRQLSYTLQTEPEQADIRVSWVNALDTRGHLGDGGTAYTAGLTSPRLQDDRLQFMEVRLATFNIRGEPQNADLIYAVAVHELGHALGLLGHSDHPEDVMFARNQRITQPSPRDIRTLRALYAGQADIDNRTAAERRAAPTAGSETAQRDAANQRALKLDEAIRRLETQSRQDGMALTRLNLGVAYFQKGRRLEESPAGSGTDAGGKTAESPGVWYDKALEAMTQAIRLEPRDPRAYHKRSLVRQAKGDFPAALSDIREAISRDRREPEYYMLQAWYLARLGRPAEAQDSLNTYLHYKPGEAGSADVRQIRGALTAKPAP
jgi:tetratricopeptide (TPR) repeat protein